MKYGYARVSTLDQKLENQIEQLKNAGAEMIVQEKLTGTTKQRTEFQDLLARLEVGDKIVQYLIVLLESSESFLSWSFFSRRIWSILFFKRSRSSWTRANSFFRAIKSALEYS